MPNFLPVVRAADSHGVARTGNERSLRAERRPVTCFFAVPNFIAASNVPNTEFIVLTDGRYASSVRRKGSNGGHVLVAAKLSHFFPARHVPEMDRLLTTPGHQSFAVRRE